LIPPNWITDTIIEFTFEYFEREIFVKHDNRFAFIRPAIVYLIVHSSDINSLKGAIPDDFDQKDTIFMPINDNEGNQAGGTHWSLLVYNRAVNMFMHYDSLCNSNERVARNCCQKISKLLNAPAAAGFVLMESPQQRNGHDCGMYVVKLTRILADRLVTISLSHNVGNIEIFKIPPYFVSSEDILNLRESIFQQLLMLSKKK
jgi:sentrin-specific protease 8